MEQFKQKKKSAKVLKQDGICYSWNRKKSVAATQGPAGRVVRGKLGKADMVWSVQDLVGTDKKVCILCLATQEPLEGFTQEMDVARHVFYKDDLGCCVEMQMERSKKEKGESSQNTIATVQAQNDDGLDQGGGDGDQEQSIQM